MEGQRAVEWWGRQGGPAGGEERGGAQVRRGRIDTGQESGAGARICVDAPEKLAIPPEEAYGGAANRCERAAAVGCCGASAFIPRSPDVFGAPVAGRA